MDEVFDLNPNTPKVRTGDGFVAKDLLLGIDSKLVDIKDWPQGYDRHEHEHDDEVDTLDFIFTDKTFDPQQLEVKLQPLKVRDFIRIKGVVKTSAGFQMLNWVYGRMTWQPLSKYTGDTKIVFMGKSVQNDRPMLTKLLDSCMLGASI